MKSIATILMLGTLAIAASSYFEMEGWGPLFLLCTGMAVLVAALVAAEPATTDVGSQYKKVA